MNINGYWLGVALASMVDYAWIMFMTDYEGAQFILFFFIVLFFGLAFRTTHKDDKVKG